jgi:hypothetical protein
MIIRKPKLKFWTEESALWVVSQEMNPKAGLADLADSYEIEWPYRVSNSLILHLPFTKYGCVIGYWRANPDFGPLEGAWVDEHLEEAIKATYGDDEFLAEHYQNDDSDVIPPSED